MKSGYKSIIAIFILILTASTVSAQVNIYFPSERAVFQRGNNNWGAVGVFGNVENDCDIVEARLIARDNGGGGTSWIKIAENPEGGAFSGSIPTFGGWYSLEIRALKNGQVVSSARRERVGIGEVFIISGQSNAQGYGTHPNAKGAVSDRVNTFAQNYFQTYKTDTYVGLPDYFYDYSFTKIDAQTNVGPGGYTPWCYGELGDMLVERLNVPVMFFNTAYGGTSSRNWMESAKGLPTYMQYWNHAFDLGFPYKTLQVTLQSINTLFGFRSILWHQGEFDSEAKVPSWTYYDNLSYVIDKSREDISAFIPWVVSRATMYYGQTNAGIIEAQNRIIETKHGVWPGPHTDQIQPNRYDNGHIQNIPGSMGLSELASVWNNSLDEKFFRESNPILPRGTIKLNHYCVDNNMVRFTPDQTYQKYIWSNGTSERSTDMFSGYASMVAKDQYGYRYSNSINIDKLRPEEVPNVIAPKGLDGCVGKSVSLISSSARYAIQWNTGLQSDTLTVFGNGDYTARFRTPQNCFSQPSTNARINFVNPPSKPQVTYLNTDGNICDGDILNLTVSNAQDFGAKWTTGDSAVKVAINKNLDQPLRVTLYSLPDCPSVPSDVVYHKFYDRPATPVINFSGPFYLQANETDPAANFSWSFNNALIKDENVSILPFNAKGEYSANAKFKYTTNKGKALECVSLQSDVFSVSKLTALEDFSLFPNPVSTGTVKITAEQEKENVKVSVLNEQGQEIYTKKYSKISYPVELDLRSYNLSGKYFIRLDYGTESKSFPMVFVK